MNRAEHTSAGESPVTAGMSQPEPAGPAASQPEWGLDLPFDVDGLVALRSAVAAHASHLGLSERRTAELVLIAHELASNAIRHGGGTGRLCLGRQGGSLRCEVVDTGGGLPEPERTGQQRASLMAPGGRGLWIVRQLADRVEITTGAGGTTVVVFITLDGAGDVAGTDS